MELGVRPEGNAERRTSNAELRKRRPSERSTTGHGVRRGVTGLLDLIKSRRTEPFAHIRKGKHRAGELGAISGVPGSTPPATTDEGMDRDQRTRLQPAGFG